MDEPLFEELPVQDRPETPRGSRPRVRAPERRQVEWRALSLDDLLPAEHRARLVWAFVERLDLGPLYAAIQAVEGGPGRPPADPRVLMALWLYATLEGVGSARALARLCREHLAAQWLCGGIGMNHKTLADFRVGHGAVLERLLIDGFAALLQAGVASLERVAQDGVRVRAAAGAASFRRCATLRECRRQAEQQIERLRAEIDADPGAASRRQVAARERAAAERQRRVEAALAAAEQLAAQRAARTVKDGKAKQKRAARTANQAETQARASTTDPEARVMKMADGGWRPAYNAQLAADTRSGLIAGVAVDNVGSDMGKMAPLNDHLAAAYGVRPREHLVDGGFAKLDDIVALAAAGVTVYAPVPQPRAGDRDPHVPLPDDPPAVAQWRQRMGTDAARMIYRERAATAECANAQARNRGLIRLLVRGTAKVKAVLLWFALAHNMACLWRLAPG